MTASELSASTAREELYELIGDDVPFETKARAALELGARYLGADNGHLARIDRETDHWEAVVSTDGTDGRFHEGLELELGTTYCRRTIESAGQIALSDVPNQGWADDPAFETHGLHCYHGTTLMLDGELYGTICFVSEDPRREQFSDGETMFTELVARMLERELERERHTTALRRQANLAAILNRVLRHNLRNEMSIIRGYTQLMSDELDQNPYGEIALSNIDKLIGLTQKARELDRIVDGRFERQVLDITTLVERTAEHVGREYPTASISVVASESLTAAVLPSFERAIQELLENAVKHSGPNPTVTVGLKAVPDGIEITVTDDGPGLPEQEQEVLRTAAETPLVHGSGLGLWLVQWVVTSHNGTVSPTVTDAGTTMTMTIPRMLETGIRQDLSELTDALDQYQAAFEAANDGMIVADDTARIVEVNGVSAALFELPKNTLLGRSLEEFLPADFDFETEWAGFKNDNEERDTVTIVGANGTETPVEYVGTRDVVPGQHLFVVRDITERLAQEAELRMKTHAMDKAPVSITISDPSQEDNPLIYANDRFCKLTGYDHEEILGRNCRFMQGPDTAHEATQEIRRAIDTQEATSVVLRNYRKDGMPFLNRLLISPVTDENGAVTHYIGFQEPLDETLPVEGVAQHG